jgi:protein-L-isoaspartate(D-aspartate) O-methyltransferase
MRDKPSLGNDPALNNLSSDCKYALSGIILKPHSFTLVNDRKNLQRQQLEATYETTSRRLRYIFNSAKGLFMTSVERLLKEIRSDMRLTKDFTGRDSLKPEILDALKRVPREEFVLKGFETQAYENEALSIGYHQTISQPFIVALMTELLDVGKNDIVLEIGTGSGYQAAVLSLLVKKVYSIEVVPELYQSAKERLARLGFANIELFLGDGHGGLPRFAPYNGIVVTATSKHIPASLLDQLAPNGVLVMPLGNTKDTQILTRIHKENEGGLTSQSTLPVRFVPLIRRAMA